MGDHQDNSSFLQISQPARYSRVSSRMAPERAQSYQRSAIAIMAEVMLCVAEAYLVVSFRAAGQIRRSRPVVRMR